MEAPLRSQATEARTAHVIVATPGRLEDLAQRRLLDLSQIKILVLDEADRMLDMGFRPQVDRIVRRPSNRQTMFFSATLDGEVGELARTYTSSPARFEAQAPADRAEGEIEHRFVSVSQSNKVETLVDHLRIQDGLRSSSSARSAEPTGSCASRGHEVRAEAMHGDMPHRPASGLCAASRTGTCPCWSRPTSPREGSTSTTSSTSSTSIRPEEDKATSTAPAAPAARARAGSRSPSSYRSSRPTPAASPGGSVTESSLRAPA